MSRLKPDFEPLVNNAIHYFRPNTAIQAEEPVTEEPASLIELKEVIRKFSLNFKPEDLKKFDREGCHIIRSTGRGAM